VRVKEVFVKGAKNRLISNGSQVGVDELAGGLYVACEEDIEPSTLSRNGLSVTLEIPISSRAKDKKNPWSDTIDDYKPLTVAAEAQLRGNIIHWRPVKSSRRWLQFEMFEELYKKRDYVALSKNSLGKNVQAVRASIPSYFHDEARLIFNWKSVSDYWVLRYFTKNAEKGQAPMEAISVSHMHDRREYKRKSKERMVLSAEKKRGVILIKRDGTIEAGGFRKHSSYYDERVILTEARLWEGTKVGMFTRANPDAVVQALYDDYEETLIPPQEAMFDIQRGNRVLVHMTLKSKPGSNIDLKQNKDFKLSFWLVPSSYGDSYAYYGFGDHDFIGIGGELI
jgi:hypothetical protein